ncbi:MAG: formylglycine-generating enzyme family protein [bacterium]
MDGTPCRIGLLLGVIIAVVCLITGVAPASNKIGIAVVDLETSPNLSVDLGETIAQDIRTHLGHLQQFDVMSKDGMSEILNKRGFLRPSGCNKIECHPSIFDPQGTLRFLQKCGVSDHEAALEIGWMLGIEKVLVGLVNKLDGRYTVSIKIFDTVTRELEVTDQISFPERLQDIDWRIEELAARLAGKIKTGQHAMDTPTRKRAPTETNGQLLDLEGCGDIKDMKDLVRVIKERMAGTSTGGKGRDNDGCEPKALHAALKAMDLSRFESMVLVPAGPFMMGSKEREDEDPIHEVFLDAFYIDKYEVTNVQYEVFLKETGHRPPLLWGKPGFDQPDQPVTGVSWEDAADYAAWAQKRLPTEAEWEKAARGTDGRRYPWGDAWEEGRCYSKENSTSDGPAPIGSYPTGVSPVGCLDMAGNVWEWSADWYSPEYYHQTVHANPQGPSEGSWHVLRGGGWESPPDELRAAFRRGGCPDGGYRCAGFRCVRDVNKVREDHE